MSSGDPDSVDLEIFADKDFTRMLEEEPAAAAKLLRNTLDENLWDKHYLANCFSSISNFAYDDPSKAKILVLNEFLDIMMPIVLDKQHYKLTYVNPKSGIRCVKQLNTVSLSPSDLPRMENDVF